jgi:RimJ/RimL family protein N-acetyltransferase
MGQPAEEHHTRCRSAGPVLEGRENMERFVTRRGREIWLRPVEEGDVELLIHFFHRLSAETRYRRFHVPLTDVPESYVREMATYYARHHPDNRVALVALATEDGEQVLVGVARCHRDKERPDEAEAAIVVRDDYQGEGLGTFLLSRLVPAAQALGIRRLTALVQPQNVPLFHLIKKSGLRYEQHLEGGQIYVVVWLDEPDGRKPP